MYIAMHLKIALEIKVKLELLLLVLKAHWVPEPPEAKTAI